MSEETIRPSCEAFYEAVPYLESFRDAFSHTDPDGDRVRNVVRFSDSVVRLHPSGNVEYLLDLDRAHPAAEALYGALCDVLGDLPNYRGWRAVARP